MSDKNYDELEPAEPLGMVRALIPDIEKLEDPANPEQDAQYLFGDSTLGRYLFLAGAVPKEKTGEFIPWTANSAQIHRAAAAACETLGRSEMLILKKITAEDLATDGSVLAAQYRQMAKQLRDEADRLDDAAADDEPGVFVMPFLRRPAQFDGDVTARGMLTWP